MFCPQCGTQNNDQAAFCSNCGAVLKTAPPPPNTGGGFTPNPNPNYPPNNPSGQGADTIIKIVAFCFPIVGLILYLVWQKDKPLAARDAGKFALIGFAVGIVLYMLMRMGGGY